MIVLATSAIPNALRGKLTRWLFELEPGIFVGNVSARVRDELWAEIEEERGQGRALLVYPAQNEQGLDFRTAGSTWQPYSLEGLTLIMQPDRQGKQRRTKKNGSESEKAGSNVCENREQGLVSERKSASEGWSIASRRRRFKNAVERQARS